ncbi:MAG: MarR family transcriptional regulator [Mesorhizobium sp.]|nr:MarR family transcriptional regulator [Mesorhizobium sp.]
MELKMSLESRIRLLADIDRAIMRWQDETQAYDDAVGEIGGLGSGERRCLGLLLHGPQTAGALATVSGLTPAAVTALMDRLEARGFVTRRRDPDDRRKVIVEATEEVRRLADIYYGPIQRQGRQMLEAFSDAELGTILEFLTSAADLQREQLSQLPLYRSSAGH